MPNNQGNKEWMQYIGLGTQWLVMLALSLWAGMSIDKRIGPQSRVMTILLPLLAIVISLWQLIRNFTKKKK